MAIAEWGDWAWLAASVSLLIILGLFARLPGIWILVAVLPLAFAFWSWSHPLIPTGPEQEFVKVEARVLDHPASKEGDTRFTGELISSRYQTGTPHFERFRVTCAFSAKLEKGDIVKLYGSMRLIQKPSNPGEFNFKEYFAHRDIFYSLTVRDASSLKVTGHKAGALESLFQGMVNKGSMAIRANMGKQEAILLEGMLFGLQGEISEEDFSTFQKTGLVHVFSVSGFHVGFIVLLGTWLGALLRWKNRTRFLFLSGLLLLYGSLTGWPVSLVRAALMAWLALLAHYAGRENQALDSLCLAGILILLVNPASLFDISFQLSFLATWGIVYLYPIIQAQFKLEKKWQKAVMLGLAAQVATLPLAAYYFNMVSLISVVANLILVDVAGVAVILGFIGMVIAQISQAVAAIFMMPAGFLTLIVTRGVEILAKVPASYLWVAKAAPILVAGAYTGILMLFLEATNRRKALRNAGTLLIIVYLIGILWPGQWKEPGRLKVLFLDVGQGDAIFIKSPGGKTILVDGGGADYYQVGKKVVLPYFRREGIRSLDLAISTHPHVDHMQGLQEVLEEIPASTIIAGAGCMLKESANHRVTLTGSREIQLDSKTMVRVWAPDNNGEPGNDTSVITTIKEGNATFLLTGDAGTGELEQYMKENPDVRATVLKVAHHGSRNSLYEPFFDEVNARYAVIMVGANNPFGHPDPLVVEELEKHGMQILRTDQNGAITFLTDGKELQVRTVEVNKNKTNDE
ncbi:MAG: DNA internalization-related competence protein ComEC/Rec2 [Chitinophagales bacterium]